MNYNSVYDLSYRLSKQLSMGAGSNTETVLEVMKDVIRSSQGQVIDSRKILSSVMKLTHIKDIRVKKLVYLYLSFVAERDSDIWLNVMNSVTNDLCDPSPFVRRSALLLLSDSYSISCSLNDTRVNLIAKRLKDPNPSVRKYAVAGIAKLYALFEARKVEFDFTSVFNDVTQMIYSDDDPSVIVECIRSLQMRRKYAIKTELLLSLLERMDMVDEWTKIEIISLFVKLSDPSKMTSEEIFQVLNLIDPYLDHKYCVTLTLSCVTAMLHVSRRFGNIFSDVKLRVLDFLIAQLPLLPTYMRGLQLSTLNSIADESSFTKLRSCFEAFIPLTGDDSFLKLQKLKILRRICTKENSQEIFKVMTSVAMTAKEKDLVCYAVETLVFVHKFQPTQCQSFLRDVLKHDSIDIVDAASIMLEKLLSLVGEETNPIGFSVADAMVRVYNKLSSFESKCAFFSLMSRFCKTSHVRMLHDILKAELSTWSVEKPTLFKITLLRATMSFFFLSPGHFQRILGEMLLLSSREDNLVLNRQALMYFNLLKRDVDRAKTLFSNLRRRQHRAHSTHFYLNNPDKSGNLHLLSTEPD